MNPQAPQPPTREEIERWHRYFAVDCNNSAWTLVEVANRTPEQSADLLRRAYAAAHHWFQVGNEVNKNRAESLLGQVHAMLGHGELAMHYAKRNHEFVLGRESDAWEVAFAHAILAHAAAVSGQTRLHQEAYAKALAVGGGLDAGDREVFEATFSQVPKP
ncbi:MAG: hypothetical protein H6830_10690 [Planctomycetes bacterium]|nr:hypothetical protein [Planctomycetota bacterium]HPF12805.1 hypothetical protein [Planctomycetota bacterium]HRV81268.1 hypothetical protein [Planctomycetota bacterium]